MCSDCESRNCKRPKIHTVAVRALLSLISELGWAQKTLVCCPQTLRLQNSMQRTCCCAESSIHPEPFMFLFFFSFSIKHQLKVSLSSCWLLLLLLCRKRSGRPRRARTDECRPLCGLRSPPVLAFRWRRERGGKSHQPCYWQRRTAHLGGNSEPL